MCDHSPEGRLRQTQVITAAVVSLISGVAALLRDGRCERISNEMDHKYYPCTT